MLTQRENLLITVLVCFVYTTRGGRTGGIAR